MKIRSTNLIWAAAMAVLASLNLHAAPAPALMEPVQTVFKHYLKIETALAKDSLKGVDQEAGAIAQAVQTDSMHMLPAKAAAQAKTLAEAKSLKSARLTFKKLSASLIQYLSHHHAVHSGLFVVHCPMAKANWLQTDQQVKNPYLGQTMLKCGIVKPL